MRKKKEVSELYKTYVKTSAVGLEVGLSIIAGTLAGYFADKYLGTHPWGFLSGIFVGILAAIKRLYTFAKSYMKENEKDEQPPRPDA